MKPQWSKLRSNPTEYTSLSYPLPPLSQPLLLLSPPPIGPSYIPRQDRESHDAKKKKRKARGFRRRAPRASDIILFFSLFSQRKLSAILQGAYTRHLHPRAAAFGQSPSISLETDQQAGSIDPAWCERGEDKYRLSRLERRRGSKHELGGYIRQDGSSMGWEGCLEYVNTGAHASGERERESAGCVCVTCRPQMATELVFQSLKHLLLLLMGYSPPF